MATSKDVLLAELDAIHEAKLRILKAGQSVTLPGSAAQINQPSFAELCKREREIRSRLLRSGGAPTRVRPDYSDGHAVDWSDA